MSTPQSKPSLRASLPSRAQLALLAQLGRPVATAAIGAGLARAADTRVGRFLDLDSLLATPKPEGDTK